MGLSAKDLEQLRYWRGRVDIEGMQTAPWSSIEAVMKQQLNIIDLLLREVETARKQEAA